MDNRENEVRVSYCNRCECWLGHRYPGFYLCYYLSTNINAKILLDPGQAKPGPQLHYSSLSECLDLFALLPQDLSQGALHINKHMRLILVGAQWYDMKCMFFVGISTQSSSGRYCSCCVKEVESVICVQPKFGKCMQCC